MIRKPFIELNIETRKYALIKRPPAIGTSFAMRVLSFLGVVAGGASEKANGKTEKLQEIIKKASALKQGNKEVDVTNLTSSNLDDVLDIGLMIMSFIPKLETEELNNIFKESLTYGVSSSDGNLNGDLSNELYYDKWFQEYPQDYFKVCAWAIWENVKPFFMGLLPATSPKEKEQQKVQ